MTLGVDFLEIEQNLDVEFSESERFFDSVFKGIILVERTDIPKEYGLITYTQDKIITIT
jgi:hypothetical protein